MNERWDVFISDRLEVVRGLTLAEVRKSIDQQEFRDDDLIRPTGTTSPWTRIDELSELAELSLLIESARPPLAPAFEMKPAAIEPEPVAEHIQDEPEKPGQPAELEGDPELSNLEFAPDSDELQDYRTTPAEFAAEVDDLEPSEPAVGHQGYGHSILPEASLVAIPSMGWGDAESSVDDDDDLGFLDDDEPVSAQTGFADVSDEEPAYVMSYDEEDGYGDEELDEEFEDEDEGVAEFTLSRSGPEQVEELDLAAMVDVAFQLVLFFLVTATTVLYKTLEVPKPNPESAPSAVAQGRGRNLDDLQRDFIVVEIDAAGSVTIDHEPVTAELSALIERLRSARSVSGRKTMLLSADFATPHRNAVMAYDAANEIGIGIAIAKPSASKS